MKNAAGKIMTSCLFVLLFAAGCLMLFMMRHEAGRAVIWSVGLYTVLVAGLFVAYTLLIRKHLNNRLGELSNTIQAITNMEEHVAFSNIEENMLSKIQAQIIKLSGILKAQNDRYQEESRAVKSLISDISHQLRTPLTNLNIYHGLLMDDQLSAEKRSEFTQHVHGQIEKLNWLLESLIMMSRLEVGMIELNKEEHNLEDTVLTAIKQVFAKAVEKEIDIRLVCDQPIMTKHDKRWTGEAIFNLLDNAVKYFEPHGRIEISMNIYEIFARIDVADHGPGMKEEEINRIFQRFYRGQNAKSVHGAGIGLYLVRQIISQQGGYVKVKSAVGKGSVFSIFLPYHEGNKIN